MKINNPSQENILEFLNKYKVEGEKFSLSSGEEVLIQKYFLNFKEWKGDPIPNTYGNKAVIDYKDEPLFAELVVLKKFKENGWEGVWVDSYRRKYRTGLPDVIEPIDIPDDKKNIVDSIRNTSGRSGGCWDVFTWKGNHHLFIELKRKKKDRVQISQNNFLESSFKHGFTSENFLIIEWDISE